MRQQRFPNEQIMRQWSKWEFRTIIKVMLWRVVVVLRGVVRSERGGGECGVEMMGGAEIPSLALSHHKLEWCGGWCGVTGRKEHQNGMSGVWTHFNSLFGLLSKSLLEHNGQPSGLARKLRARSSSDRGMSHSARGGDILNLCVGHGESRKLFKQAGPRVVNLKGRLASAWEKSAKPFPATRSDWGWRLAD